MKITLLLILTIATIGLINTQTNTGVSQFFFDQETKLIWPPTCTTTCVRRDVATWSDSDWGLYQQLFSEANRRGYIAALADEHNLDCTSPDRGGTNGCLFHLNKNFLPWHRIFTLHYEQLLQKVDRDLHGGKTTFCLGYFNWGYGGKTFYSNNPADYTYAFNKNYLGTLIDGPIPDSPYANLTVEDHQCTRSPSPASNQWSNVAIVSCFNSTDIECDGNSTCGFRPCIEYLPHNAWHNSVGGNFASFFAPSDPLFFLHHGMVDYLFSIWLKNSNNKVPPGYDAQIPRPYSQQSITLVDTFTQCYTYESPALHTTTPIQLPTMQPFQQKTAVKAPQFNPPGNIPKIVPVGLSAPEDKPMFRPSAPGSSGFAPDSSPVFMSILDPISVSGPRPIPTSTPSPVPTSTPGPVPTSTPGPVRTSNLGPFLTATPDPFPTDTPGPTPTAISSPVLIPTPGSSPISIAGPTSTSTRNSAPTFIFKSAPTSIPKSTMASILGPFTASTTSPIKASTPSSTMASTPSSTSASTPRPTSASIPIPTSVSTPRPSQASNTSPAPALTPNPTLVFTPRPTLVFTPSPGQIQSPYTSPALFTQSSLTSLSMISPAPIFANSPVPVSFIKPQPSYNMAPNTAPSMSQLTPRQQQQILAAFKTPFPQPIPMADYHILTRVQDDILKMQIYYKYMQAVWNAQIVWLVINKNYNPQPFGMQYSQIPGYNGGANVEDFVAIFNWV